MTTADEGAAVERLREAMANKANEIRLQSLAGLAGSKWGHGLVKFPTKGWK